MQARYLVIFAVSALIVGSMLVFVNHNQAISMAKQILAHDQASQEISGEAAGLANFTASHMRTAVSFELTGSYDRAVEAAKAASLPQISASIYQTATAACSYQKVATLQTKCVVDYVSTHTQPGTLKPVNPTDESSFHRVFLSPPWTPDLAGLMLAAGPLALLAAGVMKITQRTKHNKLI